MVPQSLTLTLPHPPQPHVYAHLIPLDLVFSHRDLNFLPQIPEIVCLNPEHSHSHPLETKGTFKLMNES